MSDARGIARARHTDYLLRWQFWHAFEFLLVPVMDTVGRECQPRGLY